MKKLFCAGFLMCALAGLARAQAPVNTYTNNAGVFGPTNINALHFINNATFEPTSGAIGPFDFLNVLTFTNKSTMDVVTGFLFDTETTNEFGAVTNMPAVSFGNGNLGQIYGGETGATPADLLTFVNFGVGFFPPQIVISATNVVNTGLIDVDVTGVIDISGNKLNLARGTIHVEGWDVPTTGTDLLGGTNASDLGIVAEVNGTGTQTNKLTLANFTLPGASSAPANGTDVLGGTNSLLSVAPPGASAFVHESNINVSNVTHQVVFINTNLVGVSVNVRFDTGGGSGFATPTVQWQAVVTNILGQSVTNFIYLQDIYGSQPTNKLVTNSFTFTGIPLLAPYNYTLSRSLAGFNGLAAPDPGYNAASVFASAFKVTNNYSLYEVVVQPTAFSPDPTALFSTLTNLPGRISLTALGDNSTLDLTQAKLGGANFLSLSATNHFVGSAGAQIVAPNMEINLGSTNGFLAVSNLVAPSIPRFEGTIMMYSARWTNIDATGFTNAYHVLYVDGELSPTSPVLVQDLLLRSTNVVLNDLLEVSSNLLINAQNVTLGTNSPTSQIPFAELILLNSAVVWPDSLPVVQNFTNFGVLETVGLGSSLDFLDQSGAPYNSFVNQGSIFANEITVLATSFQNTGLSAFLESEEGSISVSASTALISGGEIFSLSDIDLAAGTLNISNSFLEASGILNLSITNALADGGALSGNSWSAGNGINLTQKPVTGDLLGTTISLVAPAGLEIENTWAGMDRGRSTAGFTNNAAVGHLILNGGDANSSFAFAGPDNTNKYAIYVDLIDLQSGATNRTSQNGAQTFNAFDIASNVTVYFADAVSGSSDISEKMNGANGGKLIWVPAYAGTFSGTNVLDSAGNPLFVNRALAQSIDIDSDGDGIFNAFDATPFFSASSVKLSVTLTNLPPKVPVIQWTTLLNSTNTLYFLNNFSSTNRVVVTNFVATNGNPSFNAATKTARVVDRTRTNSIGGYQVQVIPAQP